MATIECRGLTFSAKMSVEVSDSTVPDPEPNYAAQTWPAGHVRCGSPSHLPDFVQIGAPTLHFAGKIIARGSGSIRGWQGKFMQNVTEACWTAHYDGGLVMRSRLNTDHGPLKDGQDGSLFVTFPGWEFTQVGPDEYVLGDLWHTDSPAQLFFRRYSGDPFHPHDAPAGSSLQTLVRTTGTMCFRTYLAAANLGTRSIVTLDEHHWTLTWDGQYDNVTDTWMPANAKGFLHHVGHDQALAYADVHAPPPPLSLFLQSCERFQQAEHNGAWVPYHPLNWQGTANPTLEQWGH